MKIFLALLPTAAILAYLTLRTPKKLRVPAESPDFFSQAAQGLEADSDSVSVESQARGIDDGEYNYDVVGESFRRDNLTALIRAHKAFETEPRFSTLAKADC